MRPSDLLASALFLSTASCSPWQAGMDVLNAMQAEVAPLLKRQASSTSFDLNFSGVEGNTATTVSSTTQSASASSAQSSNSGSASGSGSATTTDSDASSGTQSSGTTSGATTGSGSGSDSGTISATATTGTGGSSSNSSATTTSMPTFNPELPAGGLSMIEPNAYTTTFYKIKDFVTFEWNYTSLSVTPSAVDVLASCSANQQTYTIALNQSITGPTQTIIWDTGAYTPSQQLLTNTYTLIVHDAAKPASATAQAGYLATYSQFTFAMYLPQQYTSIANYVCVTCSGGITAIERQTISAILAMAGVTVLTFTWFTGAAGVF